MPKKDNQTKFLDAYAKTFGNVAMACRHASIDRGTYYLWKNGASKEDAAFRKQLEAIEPEEKFVDFCESALQLRIEKGDTTAIIFALKTKGKKRGYVERSETELTGHLRLEHRRAEELSDDELAATIKLPGK